MFDFIKKKDLPPPDVGQEDEDDAIVDSSVGLGSQSDFSGKTPLPIQSVSDSSANNEVTPNNVSSVGSSSDIKIERINAKLDSVVEWINQFYDRFSSFSENLGEIRAMSASNEKRIAESTQEAEKVIDMVKEVKPEQLRLDYQKVDMRMQKWEEKVESNRQVMEEMMMEFNELKKKAEVFIGVEGVIKLSKDIKKDLLNMQKVDSIVRMNADKSENIFTEIKNDFAEAQKIGELVNSLDSNYSGLKKEIERMQLDYQRVVTQNDFSRFKNDFGSKIAVVKNLTTEIEQIDSKLQNLEKFIETILSATKRNEEDIGDIALKVGDEDAKGIKDYENQISSILGIVSSFAGQLSALKKKVEDLPVTNPRVSQKKMPQEIKPKIVEVPVYRDAPVRERIIEVPVVKKSRVKKVAKKKVVRKKKTSKKKTSTKKSVSKKATKKKRAARVYPVRERIVEVPVQVESASETKIPIQETPVVEQKQVEQTPVLEQSQKEESSSLNNVSSELPPLSSSAEGAPNENPVADEPVVEKEGPKVDVLVSNSSKGEEGGHEIQNSETPVVEQKQVEQTPVPEQSQKEESSSLNNVSSELPPPSAKEVSNENPVADEPVVEKEGSKVDELGENYKNQLKEDSGSLLKKILGKIKG